MGIAAPLITDLDEFERLAALRATDILDTLPEPGFDTIARLAAKICEVPIGLVNFVDADRLWIKANCGLPGVSNVSREHGMCGRTIHERELVEFGDMLVDERFAGNPLVHGEPHLRFYAGIALVTNGGHAIGTLCVLDYVPHVLTSRQRDELVMLADLVVELVATRALVPRAIKERLDTLSAAAEHSGAPIVILTHSPEPGTRPVVMYVNRAFTSLFGYTFERMLGRQTEILYGPASDRATIAALLRGMQSGEPMDEDLVLYDNASLPHEFDMHTRPVPSEDGGIAAWVVTLRDVTEQREAARLLARQAERMRSLYEITNLKDDSGTRQIDAAIALGIADLHLEFGFVAERTGDLVTVVRRVGTSEASHARTTFALGETWAQEALAANDVRTYENLGDVTAGPAGALAHPGWGAYIVTPVNVAGAQYGVVGFSGTSRGGAPFTETDREFVRLIGAFVGSSLARKRQRDELDSLAFSDALTGLANRAMLFDRLEMALRESRRRPIRFALHYLDLDGFKNVNDRSGHAAGDAVLQIVASRLRSIVRESDTVARIGGDEFVVVQKGLERDGDGDARGLADRITDVLREPFEVEGETFVLGASVGVAVYPDDGANVRDLLVAADRALYRAKSFGKGQALFV